MIAYIIRYGEVPPNICRTLDALIYPVDTFTGDIRDNPITGPHNLNRRIQLLTKRSQIVAFRVRPTLIIFRRTHDKRCHIQLGLYEIIINIVQQFRLFLRIRPFARNIIKEHGKRADTELIHLFKLGKQQVTVFLIPFDVLSRMDSPHKVNFVLTRHSYQFLQLQCFLLRIRQTPVGRTVIRIVFRTIDISIHLILSIELQLAKTCLVTPRSSIKPFYHTAVANGRIILNLYFRQFSIFQQLGKGLQSIESAPFVISCQDYLLVIDSEIITLFMLGYQMLVFTNTLVVFFTDINTDSVLTALFVREQFQQSFYSMRISFLFTGQQVGG